MKRVSLAVLLCLGLAACTADQVTTTLELAVDAAIAAAPAVELASHASPAVQAAVTSALNSAQACLSSAEGILSGVTKPTALQASQIAAECTSATVLNLPSGSPTEIVAAVNAVANAISVFLKSLPTTSAMLSPECAACKWTDPGAARLINSFTGGVKVKGLNKKKMATIHSKLARLRALLKK